MSTDTENTEVHANPFSIKRIVIDALFGQYNYILENDDHKYTLSNLMIIYGDNGSGKTTLLQLIMHLLSPERDGGHKGFVSKVPFQHFSIQFENGIMVEAKRETTQVVGGFTVNMYKDNLLSATAEYKTDESGAFTRGEKEEEDRATFLNHLRNLNISLYYLSDDRKFYEDVVIGKGRRRRRVVSRYVKDRELTTVMTPEGIRYVHMEENAKHSPLEEAIRRVYDWSRDQAYIGSGLGDRNTNTIYNEVIKLLIGSSSTEDQKGFPSQLAQLRESLQSLAGKSREYSRFGLVTPLKIDDIIDLISSPESISPEKIPILYNVLKPFSEGIEARLRALQSVHDTLQTFIDSLKLFYKSKDFAFHVRDGLKITQKKTNEVLEPRMLSSGEKQILLLFCNTIAAKDQATIFIIDEPEISLNVKWQRQLVQALMNFVQGSSVQFLMATHSIELLARHKHNVVPLRNLTASQ